jgi:hypothetical protein
MLDLPLILPVRKLFIGSLSWQATPPALVYRGFQGHRKIEQLQMESLAIGVTGHLLKYSFHYRVLHEFFEIAIVELVGGFVDCWAQKRMLFSRSV